MNLKTLRPLYFGPIKNADKSQTALADQYLNLSYKEVYRTHRWEYRKRTGQLTIIPRYTTGTCAVTQLTGSNSSAAKTVTFTGATLTDSMRGRYFRAQGSSKWHKIVYLDTSAGIAYLDSEIVDVNGGGLTFEIWKRFYYVKSDAAEIMDFGRWGNGRVSYNPDLLDRHTDLSKEESGEPSDFSPYGVDPFDDITKSGTLSIAKNSNIATVAGGTLLSDGFDTGDIVAVGTIDYPIKRIESDSRFVLFNYVADEVVEGTSYTMRKNNPIGFEFYNPSSEYDVLPYTFLARPYSLIHETLDRIALTDDFIPAIISRAQYWGLKDSGDERYLNFLAVYKAEIEGLKAKVNVIRPRFTQFSPKVHRLAPGRY